MSLDNFRMPAFLTEELYRNSLVDLEINSQKKNPNKPGDLVFLGDNRKNIILLVNDESALYLPEEELNFLVEILAACKLSLPDAALINFNKNPLINYKMLQQHFNPEIIICFGINLAELEFPLEFPFYQVQRYNHQSYLGAPSLNILVADVHEKKQLWACLKKIFSI